MNNTKMLFMLAASLMVNHAFAQFTGTGYYRVQNQSTERYITIIDNQARVSTLATDVDFGALQTLRKFKMKIFRFQVGGNAVSSDMISCTKQMPSPENISCVGHRITEFTM